jgi:S-DNA-T family DNA segregation ATPase FtsK/SpoIIIE
VGLVLAPLAILAGALLLVRRLPAANAVGAGVLLLALAATLAAGLPSGRRMDPEAYVGGGGIVGSAVYEGLSLVGGLVGAALVLALMYAAGLFLLTGVGPRAAAGWIRSAAGPALGGLRGRLKDRVAGRAGRTAPRESRRRGRVAEEPSGLDEGDSENTFAIDIPLPEGEQPGAVKRGESVVQAEEPAFEVVLPERPELPGLEAIEGEEEAEPGEYAPPPISMLSLGRGNPEHDAEGTSRRLTKALSELGVQAQVVRAVVGPRVTRYELRLGSGVKVGKVRNLQQDIAYALAATEVRILAPIPGKSAVGVEVPNTRPAMVTLGDVFREYPPGNDWSLPVGLGKDISGRAVFFDLAEMPHLLVAGTTGAGKSVMLNGLLTSLLLTTDPRQVKMVLIDPKRVELSQFARVPHLITPVVTDAKKAANALLWAVAEMERRYEVLEREGVRSLDGYNDKAEKAMPYVVVVIDELADLMMTAAAKVEDAIIRLAQKARAVGIHLVVATQRPSVDVITGMIKANVPSRIAFAVSSQVDSRVILDSSGAESLLGRGDMLFKPVSAMRASRVQGAYIAEDEVERVVGACAERATARYVEEVTEVAAEGEAGGEPEDDLLPEAASFVVSTQQASVSAVQRRFRVGYSRAGRIIDALERKGVVGPYEGSKARAVVATELDLPRLFDAGGSGGDGGRLEDGEAPF